VKKVTFFGLLIICILLMVAPVLAAAPTVPPRLDKLPGLKINLYPGVETVSFSSNEVTHVWHGWATGGDTIDSIYVPFWSEMTSTQKAEFLKNARFELSVDGNPVELNRIRWYCPSNDYMYAMFWVVFDAGTFSVGTHTFSALWSLEFEGVPLTVQNTAVSIKVEP
jgi:hypothetical protein